MKGRLSLLFCLILLILSCSQNNSDKIIDKKIASIDNGIASFQPHKSNNTKRFYRTGTSKSICPSPIPEEPLLQEDLISNNNIYIGLSDEKALFALFSDLSVATQLFYLNPKKDTTLIGTRGTIIEIKAGSFVNKNGKPVTETVKFEVNEYLDKSEFIYARLSTNTNKGEMLESGGMLLLKAYSENGTLSLGKGKSIQFQIPTSSVKENMELFSGARDVHGNMNWHATGNKGNNKITRKKKTTKIEKSRITIEENIVVKYSTGEEVYSKKYSNPSRNTLYKNEKLDSISAYFEIDKDNVIRNSLSKRSMNKPKTSKPNFSSHGRSIFNTYRWYGNIKENEKINLNRNYHMNSGFNNQPYFTIRNNWLMTKKEKKNKDKTMIFSLQRICVYSDTLDKITIEQEKQNLKDIENRLSTDSPANLQANEVEYYMFNTSQLGWINVDRFLHMKTPKTKFVLEDRKFEKSNVSLVFKNYDSVLPGVVENGKVDFGNVPIGEEVTIVAIRMENGIPLMYMEETKIARGKTELPVEFKPLSFAELKEEIKKINR